MDEWTRPGCAPGEPEAQPPKQKNKLGWSLLFLVIAGASIWAVTAQSRSFSLEGMLESLKGPNAPWILAAVGSMLAFIYLEGLALLRICRDFGYPQRPRKGLLYAAADIYFSAITPSATGGQPASAFFMLRDGIPGAVVTMALLANLVMYVLSVLVLGLVCGILRPDVFLRFGTVSKILIFCGAAVQAGLLAALVLLLRNEQLLHRLSDGTLKLLYKLKILRHVSRRRRKLRKTMEEYRACTQMLSGRRRLMVQVFLLNLLQRMSIVAVTVFTFLATGGGWGQVADAWCMQCFTLLGANCIPVPGAMGVTDYLLLDGFGKMMPESAAVNLELLSRSVSFYSCILICGLTVLIKYCMMKRERRAR